MTTETKARQSNSVHGERPIELVEKLGGQDAPPWKHLVARPHVWRKQLSIRGRNMTVGQLVASIHVNHFSAEQASNNYDLPIDAIDEALRYEKENWSLLDSEFREERRRLKEKGIALEPQGLSR